MPTLVVLALLAAQFRPVEIVKVAPAAPVASTVAGATVEVPLRLEVSKGYHINSNKPTFEYLIPTNIEWTSKEMKLLGVAYPPAERRTFSFAPEKPLDVYEGSVIVKSRFQVPRGAKPGRLALQGKLRYQACDDKVCYPPTTVPVQAAVEVVRKSK